MSARHSAISPHPRVALHLLDGHTVAVDAETGQEVWMTRPAVAGAEGLLKKYACIACHQADAKTAGPAYKEVAAKYRGSEDAEMLFDKVKNGGVGVWGQVPMPPNATVPDAELHAMITWILAVN